MTHFHEMQQLTWQDVGQKCTLVISTLQLHRYDAWTVQLFCPNTSTMHTLSHQCSIKAAWWELMKREFCYSFDCRFSYNHILFISLTWSKFSNLSISILVSLPICGGSWVSLGLLDRSSDCSVVILQIHGGTPYKLFLAMYNIDNLDSAMHPGNVCSWLSLK